MGAAIPGAVDVSPPKLSEDHSHHCCGTVLVSKVQLLGWIWSFPDFQGTPTAIFLKAKGNTCPAPPDNPRACSAEEGQSKSPHFHGPKNEHSGSKKKKKNYFCGITLMRTTWSSSCTCCGFLQVFSAPFTSAVPQNIFFPLDLPPSQQGDILGPNLGIPEPLPRPPRLHCSPWPRGAFQEGFKGNFHPGSLKSYPGHLKATDLSILRTQGSNNFWLGFGKFEK